VSRRLAFFPGGETEGLSLSARFQSLHSPHPPMGVLHQPWMQAWTERGSGCPGVPRKRAGKGPVRGSERERARGSIGEGGSGVVTIPGEEPARSPRDGAYVTSCYDVRANAFKNTETARPLDTGHGVDRFRMFTQGH
jgi:hypothetical protein